MNLSSSSVGINVEGMKKLSLDLLQFSEEFKKIKNSLDNIELSLIVNGVMVLPCAITLKPVNYPFTIEINGQYEELLQEFDENSTNFQNTIDILPIIWENILMEIPMRVVSDEVKDSEVNMKGDGWSFTTRDEDANSPLSELMDYIDDSEVK